MKYFFLVCIMITSSFSLIGQADLKKIALLKEKILAIDSVPYMPELSGDNDYWKIVKKKDKVLKMLLQLVDDTTSTNAKVQFWGGNYKVGDISVILFSEIIRNIPIEEIIQSTPSKNKCGMNISNPYWCFVRSEENNRYLLKLGINKWFAEHQDKLVWCVDQNLYSKEELRLPEPTIPGFSNSNFRQNRASKKIFKHPAKGFYLVKNHSFESFVEITGCKCP